ncbi:MAG TPA: hypothetical protein VLQ45_13375, partial [Thermoanaerobaculia bacterium]|nr:hypothetical protein [Thermoanaerobaculia bacterium]
LKSISTLFTMMRAFFIENARPSRVMRKPLESDMVDLYHTIFMPYVDIFRTDVYMTALARKALGPQAPVQDKLEALPDIIDSLYGNLRPLQ